MKQGECYTRHDLQSKGWQLIVRRIDFEIYRNGKEMLTYNPQTMEVTKLEQQMPGERLWVFLTAKDSEATHSIF